MKLKPRPFFAALLLVSLTLIACGTEDEYVESISGEQVRVASITTWDRAKEQVGDSVERVREYFRPTPPEVSLAESLDASRDLIASADDKLSRGEPATAELKQLYFEGQDLLKKAETFRTHLDGIETNLQAANLPPVALERHAAVKASYGQNVEAFQTFLQLIHSAMGEVGLVEGKTSVPVSGESVRQALTLARQFMDEAHPRQEPPLLRGEPLPFRPIEPREEPPIFRTAITPAFQGGPPSPSGGSLGQTPTEADLAESKEIRFSDDLRALAQKLECKPIEMYEHLRNEFQVEFYRGLWKGSDATLREQAGSDFDLASVLIGLLRYCNRPARYVKGIVEIPIERAAKWVGVTDVNQVVPVLAMARIPAGRVFEGEELVAVRLEHVWVESFIPYGNYRGTIESEADPVWLPLDPSFKLHEVKPPKFDFFKESALNPDAFLRDYLSTQRSDTMVQFYREKVEAFLAANHPGATFEDAIWSVRVIPEVLGLLPNSLPYRLIQADSEWTQIPDALRYKIKVSVVAEKGPLFEYETDLPSIAGKETVLSYVAFSSDDQAILDQYASLKDIPPYLLRVTPILRIAGQEVARGSYGLMLSANHRMQLTYVSPSGEVSTGSTPVSAGNVEAIGIDIQKPVTALGTSKAAMVGVDGGVAETMLPMVVQDYLIRTDRGHREFGEALGVQLFNEVATTVVGNSITTAFVFGVPQDFAWKGLFVDSFRNVLGPVPRDGNLVRKKAFFILAGAEGSVHEHLLFEDAFQVGSVSAIRGLQFASDQGIPLLDIDASNLDTQLALLEASANLKQAIRDAIHAGRVVTIPQTQLHIQDWVGTVYLSLDPVTGAGGWMIAGQIPLAGGGTTELWPANYQELWDTEYVIYLGGKRCTWTRSTKGGVKDIGEGAVFLRGESLGFIFFGTSSGECKYKDSEGKLHRNPLLVTWVILIDSISTIDMPGGTLKVRYAPSDPDPWEGSILDVQIRESESRLALSQTASNEEAKKALIVYDIISDANGIASVGNNVTLRVLDESGAVVFEQGALSVASKVEYPGVGTPGKYTGRIDVVSTSVGGTVDSFQKDVLPENKVEVVEAKLEIDDVITSGDRDDPKLENSFVFTNPGETIRTRGKIELGNAELFAVNPTWLGRGSDALSGTVKPRTKLVGLSAGRVEDYEFEPGPATRPTDCSAAPNEPLRYDVFLSIEVNGIPLRAGLPPNLLIVQYEIDTLRQEYFDATSPHGVPNRRDFTQSWCAGINVPALDHNGHYSYLIASPILCGGLTSMKGAWPHLFQVNSAYRHPRINACPPAGKPNSQHLYGLAADIQVSDFNNNGSRCDEWLSLAQIGCDAGAQVESIAQQKVPNHVHVEWGAGSSNCPGVLVCDVE